MQATLGTVGLIKAIGTFKPDKGTRLATYAARCIENEMGMARTARKILPQPGPFRRRQIRREGFFVRFRVVGLILAFLLLLPSVAFGDAAPILTTGQGLQPMTSTSVRMESERIAINLWREGSPGQPAKAGIRVDFHFVPTADESLEVGFPLWEGRQGETFVGRVDNFAVTVGGVALPFQERPVTYEGKAAPFAVWKLDFKKDQPLDLTVTYNWRYVSRVGKSSAAPMYVGYILKTGKYWAGTIGWAEAVLTMDRPVRAEDVRPETTKGWTVKDGALRWEWRNLEPDFDLDVTLANAWWLDLPDEVKAMLAKPSLNRDELGQLAASIRLLFTGMSRDPSWEPVRGGRMSGEVALEMLPQVVDRFHQAIRENPQDWELRQTFIALLFRSTYNDGRYGRELTGLEPMRLFLSELKQYRQDGGPAFLNDFGNLALGAAGPATDQELRDVAVQRVLSAIPGRFDTEADARRWAEEPLARLPKDGLAAEIRAAVLKAAVDRVGPPPPDPSAPTAAAAAPASGPAAPPTPSVAPPPPGPNHSAGWSVAGALAFAILLGLGARWWVRRRR
jgi:hypothetical protein